MEKHIGKRVAAVILAAALMGSSLQLPGGVVQVAAKEGSVEDKEDTVSGNSIDLEDADTDFVSHEERKNVANSYPIHIDWMQDIDTLSDFADADCTHDMLDMPILLTASSKLRLFVHRHMDITSDREENGTLAWSILRGKAGTAPGTARLINAEDDWVDFEIVPSSPCFTMQEDEEESSSFYQTVTITAGDLEAKDDYDYYIRASFRYDEEQAACTVIMTIPITMASAAEEGNSTSPVPEEGRETTEAEEELSGSVEPKEGQEETAIQENLSDAEQSDAEEIGMEAGKSDAEETGTEAKESDTEETGMEAEELDTEQQEHLTAPEGEDIEENAEEGTAAAIAISKLTLNKTSAVMHPGDTLRLSAAIVPEGPDWKIYWSSDAKEIAVVDEEGTVWALAEGQAVITAQCEGKTAVVKIDVVQTDAEKNHDLPRDEEGNVIAISDEVWVAGFERESEELIYTGSKITQNLRIYHKGTLLKEKTDYTLTYKNNVAAAAYYESKAPSVTITMKGQYTGSRTLYFTIAPRNIDEKHSLGYEQVVTYSKKLKIPAPTLYFGNRKLVFNKDFVCDYSTLPADYTKGDSYEDGMLYEYTVNGKGSFTGSLTMKLAVVKAKNLDFQTAVIAFDKKQYEYRGAALSESDVRLTSVKLGKMALDESFYEYKVYAEDAGTGYVEVYPSQAGRSAGYRGMKKQNIKVIGDRHIKNSKLGDGWQDAMTFSRKKLEQAGGICQEKNGVLSYGEGSDCESLTEGVDYTVQYRNHKKVGTATVIFTGIGRYMGSVKKTYKVVPETELYIRWYHPKEDGMPVVSYEKGGAAPRFDLLELPEGEDSYVLNRKTDYTVTLKNHQSPGILTCEITGKGNYKGYKSTTNLKVLAADISQGTISVSDKQYSRQKNAWKSAVTIKDVNGKKLMAGTDYDKGVIYNYEGMEQGLPPQAGAIVYVTAVGIRNYEGSSITGSYRIYNTNISKLTVCIDAQEYTGKEIELSAGDIHVYANKNDAKKGKEMEEPCYQIIAYSNHIKAGTAKVILRGIGNYGGTRTCSFKINKKKYLTVRVAGISLGENSISLGTGNSRQLVAAITPEDAWNKTVIWTTSNSKVATVSKEGIITAIKPGKTTITAVSQDTGKKAACKVTVSVIPVVSFSLDATEIHQWENTQYQLKIADIQPAEADCSTITWESVNPEIASVGASGMVSLHKAGMTVIKAYADERRFVRKCLVVVSSKKEETDSAKPEEAYLTPQMFRTCDEEDDTEAFNRAIQNLSEECDTMYVPAGTYQIDAETGINLRSNMHFVMSSDAVLKAIGNSGRSYNLMHVNSVGNVTISGGRIIGERYEHTGASGEWGMGIGVYDSTNVYITDVNISECWGDGIYLGSHHEEDIDAGCQQITITNCTLHNNRRNNMSIVCADYVIVDGCAFQDAGGTAPELGIDIETNNPDNPCEHITISDSTFDGNAQGSIAIITAANDIKISGCTLNGNFLNYAGTNVALSHSVIRAEIDARIGVLLEETTINDGGNEEDLLAASFDAAKDSCTLSPYGIDDSNLMSYSVIKDGDSPSGKALCLKRESKGTKEAGYYLELAELTEGALTALKKGVTYRFEYVVKGSGQWGIKTNQTGWYPCAPMSDKFSTGIVTYKAESAQSCRLMLYAVDQTKDMELEIVSIKIYEVR